MEILAPGMFRVRGKLTGMMKKTLLLYAFLLLSLTVRAQLTDSIYRAVDKLVENPSAGFLGELERKVPVFTGRADSPDEQMALLILRCNMGYYYRKSGMPRKAISSYEKAWQNYQNHQRPGYDIIEFCLKPLGNLYTVSGDFAQAENTIKSYLFLAREQGNGAQETAGVLNLSVVYHNTGNFRTAVRLIEEHLQRPGLKAGQKAELLNNLASNYFALGAYDKAETFLQRAVQNHPQTSPQMYRNMAQLAKSRGHITKAKEYLNLAEPALKQQGFTARDLAKLYVEKAELSIREQNKPEAEKLLFRALGFLLPDKEGNKHPSPEILYPENTFIAIFDALATLQTDMEKALHYYDLAFFVTDLLGDRIVSPEAKIIHRADNRSRSERCIAFLYDAYQNTGNIRYLERAFEYAEQSKASVLKDILAQRSLAERFPEDSLLRKEQALSRQQETVINKLVRAQLTGKQDAVQHHIETLNTIYPELKSLREKTGKKYGHGEFRDVSVVGLQEKLREEKAAMIVYFSGKKHLYVFLFSEDRIALERISVTSDHEEVLRRFISFFDSPSAIHNAVSSYTETAHHLYKKLIPGHSLSAGNLVIVPDGLLHFIPFEALLTEPAPGSTYTTMPYLVKQQQIVYNTSAAFYLNTGQNRKTGKLLGIFPIFENSPYELRYSKEEAENIRNLTNADFLTGKNATRANFLHRAEQYDIIHLSTHAGGGDFTVPASVEFYDDTMLLHELYAMRLKPELVVLSACETGIGKLQKGEGVMSIARGFQYAGAEKLLFSLWQVNDRATARIMTSFYKNYTKNNAASAANHQSKISYLENESIPAIQKSPYYWSGFVYYGNIQQEKLPASSQIIVSGTLIALLCTALFIEFYRRKKRKKNR